MYLHYVTVQVRILSFALIVDLVSFDLSLTNEPWVPPIVLNGQVEEVLFETLNGIRLGLDR